MDVKRYTEENVYVKILDFELTTVSFYGCLYTRDEDHPYVVTEEDLREGYMSDYWGNPGDVLYNYYERD